jgi:hypothetical protein
MQIPRPLTVLMVWVVLALPGFATAQTTTSATSVNGFVGFTLRPAINDKWTFLSRTDIGAGEAELT